MLISCFWFPTVWNTHLHSVLNSCNAKQIFQIMANVQILPFAQHTLPHTQTHIRIHIYNASATSIKDITQDIFMMRFYKSVRDKYICRVGRNHSLLFLFIMLVVIKYCCKLPSLIMVLQFGWQATPALINRNANFGHDHWSEPSLQLNLRRYDLLTI